MNFSQKRYETKLLCDAIKLPIKGLIMERYEADMKIGIALYNSELNRLEVVRPNEIITRYIKCNNIMSSQYKVFGVQISGDEIWVLAGPHNNQGPSRKFIYTFSGLSGARSSGL